MLQKIQDFATEISEGEPPSFNAPTRVTVSPFTVFQQCSHPANEWQDNRSNEKRQKAPIQGDLHARTLCFRESLPSVSLTLLLVRAFALVNDIKPSLNAVKHSIRLISICLAILIVPLLLWGTFSLQPEVREQLELHDETHEALLYASDLHDTRETHLKQLTTSKQSVEMEIRRELRMIFPGEKLVLVKPE